ncbi:MAG: type II 3-dehydroquinate dehydratase [Gammaproteobacteria bacterium]|nr:type II 3-dehydroquinate dehydratase [Gammaproteobacteria bacterium]MCY4094690.1 type II 3-dehydroquinate dehydratase [Gammaproteobacteria bacterium]
MKKILLLNGPNLNLLGTREPDIYGAETLDDIVANLQRVAKEIGVSLIAFQSNVEGELIDKVQTAREDGVVFILINPGAFTHTSVALRDAFLAVEIPMIELHLSNVHAREEFRRNSYLADIAVGTLAGFGSYSYELALRAAVNHLGD